MALLKAKDALKLSAKDRTEKLKELNVEIIKARVGNKKTAKLNVGEIKKAIARLLTLESMDKIKSKTGGKN